MEHGIFKDISVFAVIVIFYLLQDWHISIDKYRDGGMHRWLDRSYMCIYTWQCVKTLYPW